MQSPLLTIYAIEQHVHPLPHLEHPAIAGSDDLSDLYRETYNGHLAGKSEELALQ